MGLQKKDEEVIEERAFRRLKAEAEKYLGPIDVTPAMRRAIGRKKGKITQTGTNAARLICESSPIAYESGCCPDMITFYNTASPGGCYACS